MTLDNFIRIEFLKNGKRSTTLFNLIYVYLIYKKIHSIIVKFLSHRDKKHVDWVRSWIELLTEMQKFVKQYYTTGLVWSGIKSAVIPPPPSGGMPPPPPPLISDLNDMSIGDSKDDRSALFAEINQGENITRGCYYYFFYRI